MYDNLERIKQCKEYKALDDSLLIDSFVKMSVDFLLICREEEIDQDIKCWFENNLELL